MTTQNISIAVYGSGCTTCKTLYEKVSKVAQEINSDLEVAYITDIAKMVELGAMSSPVFTINDTIITAGQMPSEEEIKQSIEKELNI